MARKAADYITFNCDGVSEGFEITHKGYTVFVDYSARLCNDELSEFTEVPAVWDQLGRECPMTAGYLAIYIKLSDLCGEAAEVTEMDYGGSAVDEVNSEFDSALGKAQDEVMKLAVMSMTENLCTLSNNTEL